MTAPWLARPAPRPILRWGLPDALLVFLGGVVASVFVLILLAATGYDVEDAASDPTGLAVTGVAQFVGMAATLMLTSRVKGRGTLRSDFGLWIDPRDWWYFLVGAGLQVAAIVLFLPMARLDDDPQDVVEQLDEASGVALALLLLTAVVLAPIVEELLFRGLLLRALLRRVTPTTAVAVSAVLFGAVHLVDPNAFPLLAAFVGLGVISAIIAVRSGGVGRSILLHSGFNAVTTVALVLS